jgi:hypothetical protein
MQATVRSFDATTREGTLLTDERESLHFSGTAFDRSGLRLLRPGQRVTVVLDGAGEVALVTLPGFPAAAET